MTYLIVGLDRNTLTPWRRHVLAGDVTTAVRLGCARAAAQGVQLVVAAVIGPELERRHRRRAGARGQAQAA